MNLKKIIQEEISDFDWVNDIPVQEFFVIDNRSDAANQFTDDEWVSIRVSGLDSDPMRYEIEHYNLHTNTGWGHGGTDNTLSREDYDRLTNEDRGTPPHWHEVSELPEPTLFDHHRNEYT